MIATIYILIVLNVGHDINFVSFQEFTSMQNCLAAKKLIDSSSGYEKSFCVQK